MNSRTRILIVDPLSSEALNAIDHGDLVIRHLPRQVTHEQIMLELVEAEILILRSGISLTPEMLRGAGLLRGVIRAGSGTDNIPLEYLKERGIHFAHIPGANATSVAEFAISATICFMRNMFRASYEMSQGVWNKEDALGDELHGRTVGLVGLGNIGSAIAERLISFGVRLIGTRRCQTTTVPGVMLVSFDRLCTEADVIIVQVPLTRETQHLFGRKQFEVMKRNAILVNVSRYDVVDEDALFEALSTKAIKGAIIDPLPKNSNAPVKFKGLPLLLFPHIAGSTREAQMRIGDRIRDILMDWNMIGVA